MKTVPGGEFGPDFAHKPFCLNELKEIKRTWEVLHRKPGPLGPDLSIPYTALQCGLEGHHVAIRTDLHPPSIAEGPQSGSGQW
jgi:hypothetical protein